MTPRLLQRLIAGLLLIGLTLALAQGRRSSVWESEEASVSSEAAQGAEDEGGSPELLKGTVPAAPEGPPPVVLGEGRVLVLRPARRDWGTDRGTPTGRAPPGRPLRTA